MTSAKSRRSNAAMSFLRWTVKILGTLNMAIDTFTVAIASVETVTTLTIVRALLMVTLIDVAMLWVWNLVDNPSKSKELQRYKAGAAAMAWLLFIGQIVIGVNQYGAAGIVARIAVGGALFYSTHTYVLDMWNQIKEMREGDKRPLPDRMQTLRIGIWQTAYTVSTLVIYPILVLVAGIKLTGDMISDFKNIHHVPVSEKPVINQQHTKRNKVKSIRTRGRVKSSTPEPYKDVDGLWRVKCPDCPSWVSNGFRDPIDSRRSYGGHKGGLEHKQHEQTMRKSEKVTNGHAVVGREQSGL